jgi:RloB-like protein
MARERPRAGEKPLRRIVAIRKPRKTFLIFCEGERTEPEYLNALKRQPSVRDVAAVDLRVVSGRGKPAPRALVATAVGARSRAIDEDAEIDEFWCAFDVEWPRNHPGLQEAIEEAERDNIQVAISNPCFELWLILHFQDHSRWLDTAEACRLRQRLDGSASKGLDAAKYMPLTGDAVRRAVRLDERHQYNGTYFPSTNPSSSMHRFLLAIESVE